MMILTSAEPFMLPGNRTGCLLVHGFTGTPKEMRWLGDSLHADGFSILGVRLAGHATTIENLKRTRWQDWLTSVEDGYYLLSSLTDQIFIIGLSLGGVLSLTFAAQKFSPKCPVAGIIAMASPHHLPANPLLLRFLVPLSWVYPYRAKEPPDWYDQIAYTNNICYDKDPLRGIAEVNKLVKVMRSSLPEIKSPVRLIYSKDDKTITPEEKHAELILNALTTPDKELIWIEGSGHNLTSDAQKEAVHQQIKLFILSTISKSTWVAT